MYHGKQIIVICRPDGKYDVRVQACSLKEVGFLRILNQITFLYFFWLNHHTNVLKIQNFQNHVAAFEKVSTTIEMLLYDLGLLFAKRFSNNV